VKKITTATASNFRSYRNGYILS